MKIPVGITLSPELSRYERTQGSLARTHFTLSFPRMRRTGDVLFLMCSRYVSHSKNIYISHYDE